LQDLTRWSIVACSANTLKSEPMFRREENDLVKGSMLALTIDAMLDHAATAPAASQ